MSKTDEKQQIELISRYYKEPSERSQILSFFLAHFKEEIDRQWQLAKLTTSPQREKDSEAVYALLGCFEEIQRSPNLSLTKSFPNRLRRSIRNTLSVKKNHVDITSLSVLDPGNDPEEQYALKEQIELLKDFIRRYYDAKTLYQFQLHYLDGWTFEEIADQYQLSERALRKRMDAVYDRVQKYMKRITSE